MKFSTHILVLTILAVSVPDTLAGWGNDPGKVLLKDVQTLTLRDGKMTTGRRSSPVHQLKCVGGSAQGKFRPQVVQCYNRGWDGQDVQWECKSDMDNMFRFGNIEVVCEGYDYPDDPYITKGSCGLEYTLDYTMEGHERAKRQEHNYYSNDDGYTGYSSNNYGYGSNYHHKRSSGFGDLLVLLVGGVIVYALYKTCIDTGRTQGDNQYSSTNDDYPRGNPGGGGWFSGGGSNNEGRGSNYYRGGYDDASCGGGGGGARYRGTGAAGGGGGGFWTGLATGGLAGYMFGNRGGGYGGYNRGYNRGYNTGGWGSGWGSGWGGGGFGGGSSGIRTSSTTSSGTRTASGFGGTRRR